MRSRGIIFVGTENFRSPIFDINERLSDSKKIEESNKSVVAWFDRYDSSHRLRDFLKDSLPTGKDFADIFNILHY